MTVLSSWLAHPATRGIDLDDPRLARARIDIIRSKPLLQEVYREWYDDLAAAIPSGPGRVLELGSGAGFLSDRIPRVITSDVVRISGVHVVASGTALPFGDAALKAAVMTDVLHHIPAPRLLFRELARCVAPGGVVAMIEPWLSTWSRPVYGLFHHEPYEPEAAEWEFQSTGPLSGANLALPWILFARDAALFAREFPQWQVRVLRPSASMRYILSGGVSLRTLAPSLTLPLWRWMDRSLSRWPDTWSMFALIVLTRTDAPSRG